LFIVITVGNTQMHSVEESIEFFNVNVGGTYSYQCVLQGYDVADNFNTKYCIPDDLRFLYIMDSIPALCCCFYEGTFIETGRSLIQGAV
jgi:hypothetical protein